MTPRWVRIGYVVVGLIAIGAGIAELVRGSGESPLGGIQVVFGVGWLLLAVFRDRLETVKQRQRSRVEGYGAMSFLPDSETDPASVGCPRMQDRPVVSGADHP